MKKTRRTVEVEKKFQIFLRVGVQSELGLAEYFDGVSVKRAPFHRQTLTLSKFKKRNVFLFQFKTIFKFI
jgi:hypothetical protein